MKTVRASACFQHPDNGLTCVLRFFESDEADRFADAFLEDVEIEIDAPGIRDPRFEAQVRREAACIERIWRRETFDDAIRFAYRLFPDTRDSLTEAK